jgi:hypothetical protein
VAAAAAGRFARGDAHRFGDPLTIGEIATPRGLAET